MRRIYRAALTCLLGGLTALLVGCAGQAPSYAPSIDNVETLKKTGADPVQLGDFSVAASMPGAAALQIRAFSMQSSVGKNYVDYIEAALRTELEMAKLYKPQSGTAISGVLLKNNIDGGGISTNEGQIEVRFMVRRADQVKFEKTISVTHQWESSFAGAVAIPLAANNYATMVQMLIDKLIKDPEFIKAIKA